MNEPSPRGKQAVPHWASVLRWIWSISECNLMTGDSRKRTPKGGLSIRERRGSGPENKQPKHNPCWPVGRNWRKPIVLVKSDHVTLATSRSAGKIRHLPTVCLTKVHTIVWNPNGVSTRSMNFVRWHNPSQELTAKHVSCPQLTATPQYLLTDFERFCKIES